MPIKNTATYIVLGLLGGLYAACFVQATLHVLGITVSDSSLFTLATALWLIMLAGAGAMLTHDSGLRDGLVVGLFWFPAIMISSQLAGSGFWQLPVYVIGALFAWRYIAKQLKRREQVYIPTPSHVEGPRVIP